ncbi:MAG: hypothetical protein JST35_04955 [Armatimonadetes bacterium]|nr:hypothetical protein [Armatimonadota bacterium]
MSLSLLVLLYAFQDTDAVKRLDGFARDRSVGQIRALYGPEVKALKRDPMTVMETNGAYEVGSRGWRALPLSFQGKNYVVFSTPLTSEDIGERLFQLEGGKLARYLDERDGFGWKLKRHQFDLRFDVPKRGVKATDELSLDGGASRGPLILRFSPAYKVSSIKSGAQTVDFVQAGGIVVVTGATKDTKSLTIDYSGTVNLPNYAGSITNTYAMLTNDYWYPMVARQPVPYDLTVHAPKKWVVAAQGELVDKKEEGDLQAWKYRMDLPCVFYSVSAGAFKYFEVPVNKRIYRMWTMRLTEADAKLQAEYYSAIIQFYHDTFAPYPFSGYGVVDQPNYGGGMLEAYSFNTAQEGIMPTEEPHEPAHTWWGGIINNDYLTSFWNESFAVYCEDFFARNVPIGNREERQMAFIATPQVNGDYFAAPLNDAPADIGGAASTLGYGKGAYVLQMLENEIGTKRMIAATRGWIKASKPDEIGTWEGFEKAVGADKKVFFDEWVRRPGYANFKVTDVKYESGAVIGKVEFQGDVYHLPIEVAMVYPGGKVSYAKVNTAEKVTTFKLASSSKPQVVSFDPWNRIVRKIEREEIPVTATDMLRRYRAFGDTPAYPGQRVRPVSDLPANPDRCLLVGDPEKWPKLKELCENAGFKVKDGILTYRGSTFDLKKSTALAMISLDGDAGTVGVMLGQARRAPNLGRAQIGVADDIGRFLRGETRPKTSGPNTFRL